MKRIYYILFIATLLFSCEKPISEFQAENFIKFFGSGYESKGNDVIELSDGGYLITGYDKLSDQTGTYQQVIVVKVDKNGNQVWNKTYGQVKNTCEGKVVKEVSDGYLIAGTSINVGITHSFILKTDFEGIQIFYKEFGESSYSITLTDIVVKDNNVFVAGYSDATKVGSKEYYAAKLNVVAEDFFGKPFDPASNTLYKKIFINDDQLMFLGGDDNKITMTDYNYDLGIRNSYILGSSGEQFVDASLNSNQLYILSTGSSSQIKLSKLNSDKSEVWSYVSTGPIIAKSLACQEDGSLMICGEERVDASTTLIHFVKINADGTLFNDEQYFKTIGGNIGRIIETKDKGLIIIGSTNPVYGRNIQLIKTDKDYFMLNK